MNYTAMKWGAIALTVACWGLATGLAIEKVWADGVTSYTLLIAMPVLTLAIGWLIHQGVSDIIEFSLVRGSIALALGILVLGVTLPNSIGSAGGAKDTAVAEAEAANRGITFASGELAKAEKDLADAKAGALRECEGAPAVIDGKSWPKCQWWRRQVEAHTLAVEKYGSVVVAAPVAKQALSGEMRIAWAMQKVGLAVTEKDVQLAQPMALPIAAELLCAFFMFMAFEFHRLAVIEKSRALQSVVTAKTAVTEETTANVTHGTAVTGDPELAAVSDTELQRLRRYFAEKEAAEDDPEPAPTRPRRKKSKRAQKKETGLMKLRARTLNGERPPLRVIAGRHKVSLATASRWRKSAMEGLRAVN